VLVPHDAEKFSKYHYIFPTSRKDDHPDAGDGFNPCDLFTVPPKIDGSPNNIEEHHLSR
jgi:hypothetical protein